MTDDDARMTIEQAHSLAGMIAMLGPDQVRCVTRERADAPGWYEVLVEQFGTTLVSCRSPQEFERWAKERGLSLPGEPRQQHSQDLRQRHTNDPRHHAPE